MNNIIDFLTSKEVIVVYIVAAIACFLAFIIYLIDKNYAKHKRKQNTRELNKLVEEVNDVINEGKTQENPIPLVENPEPVMIKTEPVIKNTEPAMVKNEPAMIKNAEPVMANTSVNNPAVVQNIKNDEKVPNNEVVSVTQEQASDNIVLENLNKIETLEEVKEPVVLEQPVAKVTNVIVEEKPKEEVLKYTSIEPDPEQARLELKKVVQELEEKENSNDIIDLTAYEEEQESNAIISLEELVKKSKEMYAANELSQYKDEGNEPISLQDLEKRANREQNIAEYSEPFIIENVVPKISEEEIKEMTETNVNNSVVAEDKKQVRLDDLNTIVKERPVAYQTTTKFKSSPVISPIYGIEKRESTNNNNDIELENTANYDKLDEEIRKTNEFLMTLKELQKHLD